MTSKTLYLRFGIHLAYDFEDNPEGVLFHRWVPNNEADALELEIGCSDVEIKVWFKRMGFSKSDKIEYKLNEFNFDENIMVTQGKLISGPLFGSIKIDNVNKEELEAVITNETNNPKYESIGKRVIKQYFYPNISKFLKILKINYGQYWINEIEKWDSRKLSLGAYCEDIELKWSLDEKDWYPFIPNDRIHNFDVVMSDSKPFRELMTKDDWQHIQESFNDGYNPSESAYILNQGYKAYESGENRYALVEGVCALEMAVSEYIKPKISNIEPSPFAIFNDLGLAKRASILLPLVDNINTDETNAVLRAIKLRNDVVHDGKDTFNQSNKEDILVLLKTTTKILKGPKFKFPKKNIGNINMPEEKWNDN